MPAPDTEAMEADVNSMVTKNLQVSPGPVVLSTILDISTGPSIPLSPGSFISNASSRRSCLLCLLSLSLQKIILPKPGTTIELVSLCNKPLCNIDFSSQAPPGTRHTLPGTLLLLHPWIIPFSRVLPGHLRVLKFGSQCSQREAKLLQSLTCLSSALGTEGVAPRASHIQLPRLHGRLTHVLARDSSHTHRHPSRALPSCQGGCFQTLQEPESGLGGMVNKASTSIEKKKKKGGAAKSQESR